jgi:hypothetical protein
LCRGIPVVAVNVYERKLRTFDLVFFGDQRGLWLVFLNRRRLLILLRGRRLFWRLSGACPHHQHSNQNHAEESYKSDRAAGFHRAPWIPDLPRIFPQEGAQTPRNPLLQSVEMPQRQLFRYLLLAGLSLLTGFLALAIAVPLESEVSPLLIALFSPGLKLAEMVTPETGKSFAWTFGWFLRVAIAANAAFYYALFALVAYVATRRGSQEFVISAIAAARLSLYPFLCLKNSTCRKRFSASFFVL